MEISVSVVMSVYNEPKHYISKAIDSILAQTYKAFEFIIIFDNPVNTELYSFLSELKKKDERICLIRNEKNIGLTKSLNKAIAIAKGEFIARMDADDISEINRFDEQVKFLNNNPQIGVCGSQINYINEDDKVIGCNLLPQEKKDYPYMIMPFFAHPAVMIRKRCLEELEMPYDEKFRFAQDFNLWYRLDGVCGFYNLPMKLFNYRKSTKQIGVTNAKEQRKYSEEIQMNYLRKFDADCFVDWDKLDYDEVEKIRKIMQTSGISSKAISMGCYSLFRRVNKRKTYSLFSLFLHTRHFGFNMRDILAIMKRMIIN